MLVDTLLDHLMVEQVIDDAEEQIYLRDDYQDDLAEGRVQNVSEQAFEHHQGRGQRHSKLV